MKLFKGRINISEYIVGNVIFYVFFVLIIIPLPINPFHIDFNDPNNFIILLTITTAGLIIDFLFSYSLVVRRYHDAGKSWLEVASWWFIFNMSTWAFFVDGQNKTNKYGPPPKPGINFKNLFGFS